MISSPIENRVSWMCSRAFPLLQRLQIGFVKVAAVMATDPKRIGKLGFYARYKVSVRDDPAWKSGFWMIPQ